MRKVIIVDASESAGPPGHLRKLRSDLAGHVKFVQPDPTASTNGHTGEWLITKAANAAFLVIFYTAAPARVDEPTTPPDAPPTNTRGSTLSLTPKERALLPDRPTILVAIARAEDRDRLPADLVQYRCFDLSSPDGYEALLCGLVHEPVSSRSRVKEDAVSAVFKVVMGVVATLVGGLDKTRDFLVANLNENLAFALHFCMAVIVLVLLFTGIVVLLRLTIYLLQSMQYIGSLESLSGGPGLRRYISIGVAAVIVITFGVQFFPRPLRADEIVDKHLREWARRLGGSQLPNGGIREHPDRGIAQVWSTSQALAGLLSSQPAATLATADIQRAFTFIERARITNLKLRAGMREDLAQHMAPFVRQRDLSKLPDSFPTFALTLSAIARIGGEKYLKPEAVQLIEQNKDRYFTSSESPEGWGYFEQFEWGITEIAAWTAIAWIQSLRANNPPVWTTPEQYDEVKRRVRDTIQLIGKRQIPDVGGYSPIAAISDVDYARTYPTVMALWAMAEAALPELNIYAGAELSELRERILDTVKWLGDSMQSDGWKPNPANPTDEKPFLGLTAQTLCVLGRVPFSGDRKSQKKFVEIKRSLLRTAGEWAKRRLHANDRMHDADRYLYPTQYVIEGSTFLWYPWGIGLMRSLSTDQALTEKERKIAAKILKQLRTRAGEYGSVVESEYNYVAAEALIGFNWPMDVRNEATQ